VSFVCANKVRATALVERIAPAIIGTLFNKERRQTLFFIELNGFVMRGLLVLPREKRISRQTTFAFLRSQFWRKC
jgi:hypothetical protein